MQLFCFFFVFLVYVVFCFLVLVVSTTAIDCLERLISETTCYVSSDMLNPTHTLSRTDLVSVVVFTALTCSSGTTPCDQVLSDYCLHGGLCCEDLSVGVPIKHCV